MLDTVLAIGKAFRESPNGLTHHRYIRPCPEDTDKRKILRLSLPVRDDFSLDFDKLVEIRDENYIRQNLFFLKFQTSDSDSSIKYAFGDIWYDRGKKNKESGNYRTKKYSGYSAYERANKFFEDCKIETIVRFRETFERKSDLIENILFENSTVFLHFMFNQKPWFIMKDVLNELNLLMIKYFTSPTNQKGIDGVVFDSMLYRTLCSGDPKNDIQFPLFDVQQKFKSRFFSFDEAQSLFYSIDYTENPLIRVGRSDIKIIVLPKGRNLTAEHYEKFASRDASATTIQEHEETLAFSNVEDKSDDLFARLTNNVAENIIQYDLVLSKQGGQSSPDVDLVELASIEKSHLQEIDRHIRKIRRELHKERQQEIKAELKPLSITWSFLNLLSDSTSSLKKYQSHLYKVLPQIYTGTYYDDPLLLPALIEKTESNIRNDEPNFNLLKYDFYFLTKIQNTKPEGANLMSIQESQSYHLGLQLGKLAQPLRAEIKAFEKSYVGNLSRRISTLPDLIRFKTFIEEKLVIHEKTYPNIREASLQLARIIKEFSGRYDKNECAFGFFESYFASSPSKKQDAEAAETTEEHEEMN